MPAAAVIARLRPALAATGFSAAAAAATADSSASTAAFESDSSTAAAAAVFLAGLPRPRFDGAAATAEAASDSSSIVAAAASALSAASSFAAASLSLNSGSVCRAAINSVVCRGHTHASEKRVGVRCSNEQSAHRSLIPSRAFRMAGPRTIAQRIRMPRTSAPQPNLNAGELQRKFESGGGSDRRALPCCGVRVLPLTFCFALIPFCFAIACSCLYDRPDREDMDRLTDGNGGARRRRGEQWSRPLNRRRRQFESENGGSTGGGERREQERPKPIWISDR